jgi:hypothetical protein
MLLVALVIGSAEFLRIARVVYTVSKLLELVVVGCRQSVVIDLVEGLKIYRVEVRRKFLAAALSGIVSCTTSELTLVFPIVVHLGSGIVRHED